MKPTPLEIALERIEECRRTRSISLDLSKLGLDTIPEEVFELTWLEKLDVSGDKENWEHQGIQEISLDIRQLTTLTSFACALSQITDLSSLSTLKYLQSLNCEGNQIIDLSPVSHLTALESLNCNSNQINELFPLRHLKFLKSVDCGFNELSDLSPISYLLQLQSLNCEGNQIIDLSPVSHLTALESLNCNSNQINELFPLHHLKFLKSLDCGFNELSDLSPVSYLLQLQSLNCEGNQIIDLSPVSHLTALESLNCNSNQINELFPLRHLKFLKSLDCSFNEFSDLSSVSFLLLLKFINCNSNQIIDLSPVNYLIALISINCNNNQINNLALNNLPQLQSLDCSNNNINNLALNNLPQLQSLDCSNNNINNLALNNLPQLQSLDCSNNNINNLALNNLPQLQSLDCSNNHISNLTLNNPPQLQLLNCSNNQISSLALDNLSQLQSLNCSNNQISSLALDNLSQLQSLDCSNNQISNLMLNNLPHLQSVDCSNNQISDISSLTHLSYLKTLKCFINKISDLSPLNNLTRLQSLFCGGNLIRDFSLIYNWIAESKLTELSLHNSPYSGIPPVLLGRKTNNDKKSCSSLLRIILSNPYMDNGIENIKHYREEILASGSAIQKQLKVQFVGNGRVGKTTLAYVMEHKRPPCESFKSTHGIIIKEIQQLLDGEDDPITLQLWDFGGQEIYHATHRLFLSDDCLYLLLWAEETEEYLDETCHPVSYWLESIHDLGKNSPVILVKNQIDISDKQLSERPVNLSDDLPGANQISHAVKVSAWTGRNMSILRGAIEAVIEELKYRVCLELPTSWLRVQKALKQLNQKSIPFAHFKQLCIKAGVSHAEWFADYLHKTGVLFYREGAFQDQIILDQNWAINAVYRAFDPNKPHRRRIERMGGRFNGEDASLFWADEEVNEQEVYVDFMHNCGICYEPKRQQNQRDNKPFAKHEFIIPALLPLTSKAKTAWGNSRPDDWQLDIEYPFLHRSIIERMILRIGETYEGEPWRTGIFCETDEGQLLLECEYANKQQSTQGRLHFQLRGCQPERLVYALRKLVSETSPHRRYQEYLSKVGAERTLLPEFKDEAMQHPSKLDASKPADKTIKLFISYSHADEAHKERLEKHLKAISRTLPLTAWSDRHLFAGEAVDEQIFQQLNTADIVLLLVSPDFINSDYCFTKEMERALERYQDEGNVVIPVIIRHTASWRNHKIGQIVALPKDGKPLAKWEDADEFWGSVENGIHDQVKKRLQA